ncbi:YceD family protein [Rhodobacter sp.]
MTETEATTYRTAALSHRKVTRFRLAPDAAGRAAIAASLDLIDLPELVFEGEIAPAGRADFTLTGHLRARVVQACIVTLEPVPAVLDERITRRFLAEYEVPEGEEVEMPEDDSAEPLPEVIDLAEILREAMALALPLYPRAAGAELGEAVFAADGTEPLRDQDLRPFAGLAALVRKDPQAEG